MADSTRKAAAGKGTKGPDGSPGAAVAATACGCGRPATLRVRATGHLVCAWHKPDGFAADRVSRKA